MDPLHKCVWMTAGVLNFRLCDREYDCDHCLVDLALREGKSAPSSLAGSKSAAVAAHRGLGAATAFRPSRSNFCHPCHLVVRVGSGGTVRIGIDELASRLLGPVKQVRLPVPGTVLQRDCGAWVFQGEAGEAELPAPVGGRVVSRNESLVAYPQLLRETTRREIWLARIRPSRLRGDLERLLYGRRALAWMRGEVEKIRGHLLSVQVVGTGTLPDGGGLDPTVLDRIEVPLRRALIEMILLDPGARQKGR